MKQGEIWTAVFLGAVGHEYQKDRPVLIIESDQQLDITNIVTLVPLSSKIENKFADDILIKPDVKNGLRCVCLIKPHHITSFDKTRFIRKIGEVDEEVSKKVKEYLRKHFGL